MAEVAVDVREAANDVTQSIYSFLFRDEPDRLPFEGDVYGLSFPNAKAPIGEVRYGDLEIIVILALFEKERML